jgi:hypothetical protein
MLPFLPLEAGAERRDRAAYPPARPAPAARAPAARDETDPPVEVAPSLLLNQPRSGSVPDSRFQPFTELASAPAADLRHFSLTSPDGLIPTAGVLAWPADSERGFFKPAALDAFKRRLNVDAKVVFGVTNSQEGVRGFPPEMACSNASWWLDRLQKLTSWNGAQVQALSRGTYNSTASVRFTDPNNPLSLWLPHRIAYGGESPSGDLILRKSACSITHPDGPVAGCRQSSDRAAREIALACLAASAGFGPSIVAAWMQPAVALNNRFVGGRSRPPPGGSFDGLSTQPYEAGWRAPDGGGQIELSPYFIEAVVIMERFPETMELYPAGEMVQAALRLAERLAEHSVLHMDLKRGNVVGRREGGLELRAIDFDPLLCKVTPWIPKRVLVLLNFAMMLAEPLCLERADRGPVTRLRNAARPVVQALVDETNDVARLNPSELFGRFLLTLPGSQGLSTPAGSQRPPELSVGNDLLDCRIALKAWLNAYLVQFACIQRMSQADPRRPIAATLIGFVLFGEERPIGNCVDNVVVGGVLTPVFRFQGTAQPAPRQGWGQAGPRPPPGPPMPRWGQM